MSYKLNEKELYIMRKRGLLLNERLQSVSDMITGRSAALAEFINGEDGKPSEKKTDALISELIGCLKRRRELENRRAPENDAEEMYRAFLYLAILGLTDKRIGKTTDLWRTAPSESFADVIGAAEELEPSGIASYKEFLLADLDRFILRHVSGVNRLRMPVHGTLGLLMYVMSDGMDSFVLRELHRRDQVLLCNEYAKRFGLSGAQTCELIGDVMDNLYGAPYDDGYDEYIAELAAETEAEQRKLYEQDVSEGKFSGTFEEYLAKIDEPALNELIKELEEREAVAEAVTALGEEESYEDSEKLRGYSAGEIKEMLERKTSDDNWDNTVKWLDALPSAERYCAEYRKFVGLYFNTAHDGFANGIAEMIDVFLFEHGLSAFSFGDDYVMLNYHFDKFKARVEAELARGAKK